MIPYFDRFVDTREKRYHVLLIILLSIGIWMFMTYLVVGYQLLQLQSYEELFALLKTPYIEWMYISRIIVDAISITNLTIPNGLACFINNISILEGLAFFVIIISFGILEKKRITTIVLSLLVMEVLGSCGIAFHALQSSTLADAIQNIRLIGIFMFAMNTVLLIIFIYYAIWQLRKYHDAMQYQVEEIKEHMVD